MPDDLGAVGGMGIIGVSQRELSLVVIVDVAPHIDAPQMGIEGQAVGQATRRPLRRDIQLLPVSTSAAAEQSAQGPAKSSRVAGVGVKDVGVKGVDG